MEVCRAEGGAAAGGVVVKLVQHHNKIQSVQNTDEDAGHAFSLLPYFLSRYTSLLSLLIFSPLAMLSSLLHPEYLLFHLTLLLPASLPSLPSSSSFLSFIQGLCPFPHPPLIFSSLSPSVVLESLIKWRLGSWLRISSVSAVCGRRGEDEAVY